MPYLTSIALSLLLYIAPQSQKAAGTVVSVQDGANIVVAIDGAERPVKLAGVLYVDLDEDKGKAFLRSLVEGQVVSVEFTNESTALVYRESDSLLINLEMIRKGFALVDHDLSTVDTPRFQDAQAEAEEASLGMWDLNRPDGTSTYTVHYSSDFDPHKVKHSVGQEIELRHKERDRGGFEAFASTTGSGEELQIEDESGQRQTVKCNFVRIHTGTRVHVIAIDHLRFPERSGDAFPIMRLRILSGENAGETVWMADSEIEP
jgi:endonuclease YncB( thermonuclease family)